MGRIYFKMYYTPMVETFLKAAVRGWHNSRTIPLRWTKFAEDWIEKQSEEDKKFIRFVFNEKFQKTYIGVSDYVEDDLRLNEFLLKYRRLAELERRFAVDAGLHSDTMTEGGRSENDWV